MSLRAVRWLGPAMMAGIIGVLCAGGAAAQENDLARVEALNGQIVQAFRERGFDEAIAGGTRSTGHP